MTTYGSEEKINILGVKIDNLARQEILERIDVFLSESSFHQIATINPEFILMAQKDDKFQNILNGCALNVADGVGINLAFWKKGKKLKSRIAGIDLMMEILRIANEKNLSVFLVADSGGLSSWEETGKAILEKYPDLKVAGINSPKVEPWVFQGSTLGNEIVFCNFGAPLQEKFLNNLKNDRIRLAVGVGGGFDFITGKIRRAPAIMRQMGLEWLWRLILEPRYRFRRVINAVIVFPIKILLKE